MLDSGAGEATTSGDCGQLPAPVASLLLGPMLCQALYVPQSLSGSVW